MIVIRKYNLFSYSNLLDYPSKNTYIGKRERLQVTIPLPNVTRYNRMSADRTSVIIIHFNRPMARAKKVSGRLSAKILSVKDCTGKKLPNKTI